MQAFMLFILLAKEGEAVTLSHDTVLLTLCV